VADDTASDINVQPAASPAQLLEPVA
jgi:hypothetical protein